jgi:uncharacterized surface protein with fasciclin (FAS1) repeats
MARSKRRALGGVALTLFVVAITGLIGWQAGLATTQAAASADSMTTTYVVKGGDSLRNIAVKYDMDVATLAAANNLAVNSLLYKQQSLTIPAAPATNPPAPADAAPAADVVASGTTYKVKAGDSLRSIARALGVDLADLAALNGLAPNALLYKHQALQIPVAAAAEAAAPEVTAEPVAEATPEATPEPTPEATPEATEEPAAEAPVVLDIIDTAATAGSFHTLLAAVEAAGLTDALKGEGPFTVFAPTDNAFAALPPGTVDALLADPGGALTQILLYHVLGGAVYAADLSEGLTANTLQGSTLTFSLADGPTVNGVNITVTDIQATNGVIHVIDAVLLPPAEEPAAEATPAPTEEPAAEATPAATAEPAAEATPEATPEATSEAASDLGNIIDTAAAAGDFTTLLAAIDAAGLTDALKGEGPFTVFAPTDAAFAALPPGTVDALLADPGGDLTQILLYHVVAGAVLSTDLSEGLTAVTLQGNQLTFTLEGGAKVNDVNIVITDIPAANGVIHVIDAVLLPPTTASATDSPGSVAALAAATVRAAF